MQAGKTPLDSAIKSRRRDCINVLRDALEVGRIELQGALIRGDVSKVKSIMKKGGDIDFFDKEVRHHRSCSVAHVCHNACLPACSAAFSLPADW